MELADNYIKIDEDNVSNYKIIKILNSDIGNIYTIYQFSDKYIYYDEKNIELTMKLMNKKFNNINEIINEIESSKIEFIENNVNKISNIFNIGLKKTTVKTVIDKRLLEINFLNLEKKKSIDSNIPVELLLKPKQIFNMIFHEIDKINKNHSYPHYYQPINNDIYNLSMKVFYNDMEFEFNVKLDGIVFPFFPPKINIVKPKLERKVLLTVNNLDELNINGWNPMVSLEYLINIYAKNIYKLVPYISKDNNYNKDFEILNSDLATLTGIKIPKIIDFNLEFNKINFNKLSEKSKDNLWKSGTGYGHSSASKWDIKDFYKNRDKKEKKITNILTDLNKILITMKNFEENFKNSVIESYIKDFIKSINILDCSKKYDIYIKSFEILENIIKTHNFKLVVKEQYQEKINNFYDNAKRIWEENDFTDENLGNIITKLDFIMNKIIVEKINNPTVINCDKKKKYEEMVRKYQFMENEIPSYYHYKNKKSNFKNKKSLIRIMSENQSIKESLPVNWDSSILFRINKKNINYASFFIIGPEGTPYHNGIFEFHMYYPDNYPLSSPQVNLMTTGNGSVRFNPNLYECGKVCLSLLGTWSGELNEKWNPQVSTVLQVLISIQSLIFIDEPYFNEPGFEKSRYTEKGIFNSKKYNELRQLETIRWAINDKIENLTNSIEEFTKEHFLMKKDEIINVTKKWYDECEDESYKNQMEKEIERMNKLFDKLI